MVLGGIALAASCLLTQAEIVTLQTGATNVFSGGANYTGVEDNTLVGLNDNRNYGGRNTGWIGADSATDFNRLLIRFDLTSLAGQNVVVTSAVLKIRAATSLSATVDVYRVSTANADWIEGTGNGGAVAASCWLDKKYSNIEEWAGSPGLSTAGTDYFSPAISSGVTDGAWQDYTFNDVSFMAGWIAGTDNGGVMLSSAQLEAAGVEKLTIYTSENAAGTAYTPVLELGVVIPAPATISLVVIAGLGGLLFRRRLRSR